MFERQAIGVGTCILSTGRGFPCSATNLRGSSMFTTGAVPCIGMYYKQDIAANYKQVSGRANQPLNHFLLLRSKKSLQMKLNSREILQSSFKRWI